MAITKTVKARTMAERASARNKRFKRTRRRSKDIILSKIVGTLSNFSEANMVRPSLLDSLPSDVISEVLARVASSSVPDLFRCKLSCKTFEEIGKEKYVIRKVGIEELNSSPLFKYRLRNAALAFFQLCLDSNNPEALFQQGMSQYFSQVELEEGVRNLERAANLGHKIAAYVLGLILVCCGSEYEKNRGMDLINCVKACAGKRIVECRLRLQEFLSSIWLNNILSYEWKPISCAKEKQHGRCQRRCPWKAFEFLLEDDDDTLFCEACSCEYESKFFLSLFHRSI